MDAQSTFLPQSASPNGYENIYHQDDTMKLKEKLQAQYDDKTRFYSIYYYEAYQATKANREGYQIPTAT